MVKYTSSCHSSNDRFIRISQERRLIRRKLRKSWISAYLIGWNSGGLKGAVVVLSESRADRYAVERESREPREAKNHVLTSIIHKEEYNTLCDWKLCV